MGWFGRKKKKKVVTRSEEPVPAEKGISEHDITELQAELKNYRHKLKANFPRKYWSGISDEYADVHCEGVGTYYSVNNTILKVFGYLKEKYPDFIPVPPNEVEYINVGFKVGKGGKKRLTVIIVPGVEKGTRLYIPVAFRSDQKLVHGEVKGSLGDFAYGRKIIIELVKGNMY